MTLPRKKDTCNLRLPKKRTLEICDFYIIDFRLFSLRAYNNLLLNIGLSLEIRVWPTTTLAKRVVDQEVNSCQVLLLFRCCCLRGEIPLSLLRTPHKRIIIILNGY